MSVVDVDAGINADWIKVQRQVLDPFAKHGSHDQSSHGNRSSSVKDGDTRPGRRGATLTYIESVSGGPLSAIRTTAGSTELGYLSWKGDTIDAVHVSPRFRRNGIATEMLAFAREVRPDLKHSDSLLPDGEAWANVAKHGSHDQSSHGNWAGGHKREDLEDPERARRLAVVMEYRGLRAALTEEMGLTIGSYDEIPAAEYDEVQTGVMLKWDGGSQSIHTRDSQGFDTELTDNQKQALEVAAPYVAALLDGQEKPHAYRSFLLETEEGYGITAENDAAGMYYNRRSPDGDPSGSIYVRAEFGERMTDMLFTTVHEAAHAWDIEGRMSGESREALARLKRGLTHADGVPPAWEYGTTNKKELVADIMAYGAVPNSGFWRMSSNEHPFVTGIQQLGWSPTDLQTILDDGFRSGAPDVAGMLDNKVAKASDHEFAAWLRENRREGEAIWAAHRRFTEVRKHGSHDQSSHGNWARGGDYEPGSNLYGTDTIVEWAGMTGPELVPPQAHFVKALKEHGLGPSMVDAFHGFSDGTYVTTVRDMRTTYDGELMIEGNILGPGGDSVGHFLRVYDTPGVIEHSNFSMTQDHRGTGFAKKWMDHAFDEYKENGIVGVKVDTASVGSYAWAKLGARPSWFYDGEAHPESPTNGSALSEMRRIAWRDYNIKLSPDIIEAIDQTMMMPKEQAYPILYRSGWSGVFDLETNPYAKALIPETLEELWDATLDDFDTEVLDPFKFVKHGDHDQSSHGNWARGGKYRDTSFRQGNPFYAAAITGRQNHRAGTFYQMLEDSDDPQAAIDWAAEYLNTEGLEDFRLAADVWTMHQEQRTADEQGYRDRVESDQIFDPDRIEAHGEAKLEEMEASLRDALGDAAWKADRGGHEYFDTLAEAYGSRDPQTLADNWNADNQSRLDKMIPNAEVHVRITEDALLNLVADGEFKTVHDEGAVNAISEWGEGDDGNGAYRRRRMEEKVFGSYPTYGYLWDDQSGIDGYIQHSLGSPQAALSFYGDVSIRLKDEVRERTTFTAGDSFANQDSLSPSPMTKPHYRSAIGVALHDVDTISHHDTYFEAQVHGKLTTQDIEAVVFSFAPDLSTRVRLAEAKIPFRVVEQPTASARDLRRIRVPSPIVKHADHDQSSHGNWARGGGTVSGHAGSKDASAVAQARADVDTLRHFATAIDAQGFLSGKVAAEAGFKEAAGVGNHVEAVATSLLIERDADGLISDYGDNEFYSDTHKEVYDFWMATFDNADAVQQAAVNLLDADGAATVKQGMWQKEAKPLYRLEATGAAHFMLSDIQNSWAHEREFSDVDGSLYRGMKMGADDWGVFFDGYKGSPKQHIGETVDLNLSSFTVYQSDAESFSIPTRSAGDDPFAPSGQVEDPHSKQRPVIIETRGYVAGYGANTGEVITAGRFKIVDYEPAAKGYGNRLYGKLVIEQEGVWDVE